MFQLESKKPKILVVGDLMIDHYIWGSCSRISPEAPVQVVDVKSENNRLGGACNVVNNLISLGADVSVCGVIGDDENGRWLVNELQNLGVNINHIFIDSSRPTTKKSRVLISNQQVLRIDRESSKRVDSEILQKVRDDLESLVCGVDCVIISDYNKGLLDTEFTQSLIKLARSERKIVLCDPKGRDYSKYRGATLLTPNKKEASEASGVEIISDETLLQAGLKLKESCDLAISLITLSEDGIGIIEGRNLRKIPTFAMEVYDVTGAGDTVIAALGFALSSGLDIYRAAEFANFAAGVVVAKVGSATATHAEIDELFYSHSKDFQNLNSQISESKIVSKEALKTKFQNLKAKNPDSQIVFTNGCFDILHKGHAQYLAQARALGDVLVVGLNSDDSVKRLKGEKRPINSQDDRAFLLASLASVDFVVIFEQDTPRELIEFLRPDILVKGADYEGKEVVGSEFVSQTRLIPFVQGKSSTNIINKIKEQK